MSAILASINWVAVAVAAVAAFFLGALWYTALFGKVWRDAREISDATVEAMMERRPMGVFLAWQLLAYSVLSVGMALVIAFTGAVTAADGAVVGGAVWLVVAAAILTNHLPTPTKWSGYVVDAAFAVVYCVGTGVLLAAWR